MSQLAALTPADRSWMGDVIQVVLDTWSDDDPAQPTTMQYKGSDDYLRSRFEEYVFGFLSTAKYAKTMAAPTVDAPLDPYSAVAQFGPGAIDLFRTTRVFQEWDGWTDETLCDLVGYKHPCSGKVTVLSDATLRLTAGLHDLRIDESLAPTREKIGAAFQAGSAGLSKVASSWRTDLARLNQNWHSSQEKADDASSGGATTPTETSWELRKNEALFTLQATGAQGYAALGQFGSFLSTKQKNWAQARRAKDEDAV